MPATDPLATHGAIVAAIGRLAQPDARLTPVQLAAVFHVDAYAEGLRATLTAQYLEHSNRSSQIEKQLWQALFDLTQGFLLCYRGFAQALSSHPRDKKWQTLLPELIARQLIHHGLDAKIRLYRYEQWIPGKWAELHALFQAACSAQTERKPMALGPGGGPTTIEREYLRILVLQLMNAGNLTPRHLEWLAQQLPEWCSPLRLTMESSPVTGFYVDLDARGGLKRRGAQLVEGRLLFLDTRPLHAVLMQNAVMLEHKVRNNPLSERTSRRADQLNLLSKLASSVDPEFKPFVRRGERTSAQGNVDAIVGFAKIAGFLHDEAMAPFLGIRKGPATFGESIEFATFGRMRNEHSKTLEQARRRLATYTAEGGPWEMRDISRSGYRLIAPMSAVNAVVLGTLVAIRPQSEPLWALGIVRRMKRATSERAEIGLQLIANNLVGVQLAEPPRPGPTDYSVSGAMPPIDGRRFHGLFLSLQKREGEPAVQTLIVPASEYQVGKRLRMSVAESSQAIAFGHLLEQRLDWIWATIDSLDAGPPTKPIAP